MYDDGEMEVMKGDVDVAGRLGCEGVVVGCLDGEGRVDVQEDEGVGGGCEGVGDGCDVSSRV